MTTISLALTIATIISGVGLLGVASDTITYNSMPRGRWKWLLGLLITTIIFSFLAIITNGKDCYDYSARDYKYGDVPINCPIPDNLKEKNLLGV